MGVLVDNKTTQYHAPQSTLRHIPLQAVYKYNRHTIYVTRRGIVWCCVVLRGAAWCCVVLRGVAWHCMTLLLK